MHSSFDMKIVITKKVYSHMMLFPIIAMMSLLLSVYSSVSHETQKVKILPSPNSYKMVYSNDVQYCTQGQPGQHIPESGIFQVFLKVL